MYQRADAYLRQRQLCAHGGHAVRITKIPKAAIRLDEFVITLETTNLNYPAVRAAITV